MLGKLLKYEFKSTARIFVLLYAALLLVALVNALLFPVLDLSAVSAPPGSTPGLSGVIEMVSTFVLAIASIMYILLVVAVLIMTLVVSVVRFYRLLGDEGYLWLTLPVTADTHIISKLISSLIWFITSLLAVALSLGILFIRTGLIEELPAQWNMVANSGFTLWLWILLTALLTVISWISSIMMFYTAIAIGPNILKSRLGGSVIAYIAIYFVQQTASSLVMILGVLLASNQIEALGLLGDVTDLASQVASTELVGLILVAFSCIFYLVFIVVLYLFARHFMTRKLNLT
jgi:hypothetical protein